MTFTSEKNIMPQGAWALPDCYPREQNARESSSETEQQYINVHAIWVLDHPR